MSRKGVMGLSAQLKDKLIQQTLERRLRQAGEPRTTNFSLATSAAARDIPEEYYRFALHPGYQQLRIVNDGAAPENFKVTLLIVYNNIKIFI